MNKIRREKGSKRKRKRLSKRGEKKRREKGGAKGERNFKVEVEPFS